MTGLVEVWRGGVNAWECDENGHLNTRFYVLKAGEALAMLFARSGLPGVFSARSATTPIPREMHIRFFREALLSAPLRMVAGFTGVSSTGAEAVLVMEDISTGEAKATFRIRVENTRAEDTQAPCPWPAKFGPPLVPTPEAALPRSTGSGPAQSIASADAARVMGLMPIAAGVIGADRLDVFGRMVAHGFIGAVSDGIRTLSAPMRALVMHHADEPPARLGGAVVEFRVLHHEWPRGGDAFEICSGLAGIDGHAKSLIHWMFDPISGRVYGSMQSIAVDFDLDRRRLVKLNPATRAALMELCIPGLAL